jgi:hypothetical protein
MKKVSSKTGRQRRRKQEDLPDRLERLSRQVASTKLTFDSGDGNGRSASGLPYRRIIE